MVTLRAALAAALFLVGASQAFAQASGTALGVDPDAEARGKSDTRTLVVGSDIFIGDRVVTGDAGLVQIMFVDKTRLVVGPRSSLVIEDYLIRNDGSSGRMAINALSGSFRFITGAAPKDRYVIKTPTGTIGVRGTALDIWSSELIAYVLQLHGSSFECPDATPTDCAVLEAACELAILGDGEVTVIGHTDEISGAERERLKQMFSLINANLLRDFRVAQDRRCLNRPAGASDGGKSLIESGAENAPQYRAPPKTPDPIIN